VMTARPGRILEDRGVLFPRPRTVEMSYDPEFAALVQALRRRIAEARSDGGMALTETGATALTGAPA